MDDEELMGEVDVDRDILEWMYTYDEEDPEIDDLADCGAEL